MSNVELGKELLSLKKRIAELEAKLNEPKQPEKPFGRIAKLGGHVYRVDTDGVGGCDPHSIGQAHLRSENLNVWFRTNVERDIWLEEQKLRRDIREFIGHDPDWSDTSKYKYEIGYNHSKNILEPVDFSYFQSGTLYGGNSNTQAHHVLDEFGDRIKKYIFKIKE